MLAPTCSASSTSSAIFYADRRVRFFFSDLEFSWLIVVPFYRGGSPSGTGATLGVSATEAEICTFF